MRKKIHKNYKKLYNSLFWQYKLKSTLRLKHQLIFKKAVRISLKINNFRMFNEDNSLLRREKYNEFLGIFEERLRKVPTLLKRIRFQIRKRFKKKTIKRYSLTLYYNYLNTISILPKYYHYINFFFFKKSNKFFHFIRKILMLNFRKARFFPSLQSIKHHLYTTTSLGMFSKFFKKGKAFIKNKANFLVSAGFLRKILIYADIKDIILMVKRTPIYLTEILTSINSPVIANYKHPFMSYNIDEMRVNNHFFYHYFIFFNTKAYGFMKRKKKGRVKRKITKRIVKINQFTD